MAKCGRDRNTSSTTDHRDKNPSESKGGNSMADTFEHRHLVNADEIDPQRHANNIAYFQWMQAAAIEHSKEQGWSTQRYQDRGWAWVVRSHFIEYRCPVFECDEILVRTWVADMKKFTSLRKFEIVLKETGKLAARAETNWAFVERETGRLIAIPTQVSESFVVLPSTLPERGNSAGDA